MTDWDAGGWEGGTRQEDAWLATTPAQRLAWLEEAIVFARTTLAPPWTTDPPVPPVVQPTPRLEVRPSTGVPHDRLSLPERAKPSAPG